MRLSDHVGVALDTKENLLTILSNMWKGEYEECPKGCEDPREAFRLLEEHIFGERVRRDGHASIIWEFYYDKQKKLLDSAIELIEIWRNDEIRETD